MDKRLAVRTQGISPKVKNQTLIGVVTGLAILVLWFVAGQASEPLLYAGIGIVTAAVGGGVVGYQTPPVDSVTGAGLQVADDPSDVAEPWGDGHGDQAGVSPDVAAREGIPEDTK